MQTQIKAIKRGTSSEIAVNAGQHYDLNVSQFLPKYAQLCAAGKVFAFDMSGGTAKIPVATMPTTSPEWAIYNANTTAYLVLLRVAAIQSSGTAGTGLTIVCTSAIGAQTAVAANYASSIVSCLDGTAKTPNAYITNNPTLVGGTPAWVPFGTKDMVASGAVAKGTIAEVDGLIVAPPRGAIGIEFYAPLGNLALFDCMVVVAELDIDVA